LGNLNFTYNQLIDKYVPMISQGFACDNTVKNVIIQDVNLNNWCFSTLYNANVAKKIIFSPLFKDCMYSMHLFSSLLVDYLESISVSKSFTQTQ